MNFKQVTISKIKGLIKNIDDLLCAEFPYNSSRTALENIRSHFDSSMTKISSMSEQGSTVEQLCKLSSADVVANLPIIGLLSNSANVRNIFEFHEPFWNIASKTLYPDKSPRNADVDVVISSEWRMSPFVYAQYPDDILKDYILIGMPASECTNPLLFPLAGHELGHIIWKKNPGCQLLIDKIRTLLSSKMIPSSQISPIDMFVNQKNARNFEIICNHASELFCDCLGIRIFRESYIRAFLYIILPFAQDSPSRTHPYISSRIDIMEQALKTYGFELDFEDINKQIKRHDCNSAQCNIICNTLADVYDDIIELVDNIIRSSHFKIDPIGTIAEQGRIVKDIKQIVPSKKIQTLSDIINAGWELYEEMENAPIENLTKKILFDLVAKNFEILTIEERIVGR